MTDDSKLPRNIYNHKFLLSYILTLLLLRLIVAVSLTDYFTKTFISLSSHFHFMVAFIYCFIKERTEQNRIESFTCDAVVRGKPDQVLSEAEYAVNTLSWSGLRVRRDGRWNATAAGATAA